MIGINKMQVANSRIADIQPFCQLVLDGYSQTKCTALPQHMLTQLEVLTNTLAEGMQEAYQELSIQDQDSPIIEAQKELWADTQRRIIQAIPDFESKTGTLSFEGF